MRITASDCYGHRWNDCDVLDDCQRRYCKPHRLLWQDCETAKEGIEGDSDVINGIRGIVELGDCPKCERDSRFRRWERAMEAA